MNELKDNFSEINFDKYENTPITLEKITDVRFDNNHPNGYNVGFSIERCFVNIDVSKLHQVLYVQYGSEWFHTSTIEKQEQFEGYDLLYTLNSIYKITPILNTITEI